MKTWIIGTGRLLIRQGDLTRANVDAIVNAANPRLEGGGGVDGAIHAAAGKGLVAACRRIHAERGDLEFGEVVITPGFDLPALYVIHTPGPIWRGGKSGEPEALRRSYWNSLDLARKHGLRSIAFPAISCGVYGYPMAEAMPIALKEIGEALEAAKVREASMWLYGEASCTVWIEEAQKMFGAPTPGEAAAEAEGACGMGGN